MLTRTLRPLLQTIPRPAPASRTFTSAIALLKSKSNPKPNSTPQSPPSASSDYAHRESTTPLNPHLTNTTSTLHPSTPSIGAFPPPPEFLSTVSPSYNPLDSNPENTARLTGNTQDGLGSPPTSSSPQYHTPTEVLTHLHTTFNIPPLPRSSEDLHTLRSRLQYQSRKRGILETDLLLSTFADKYLPEMTREQLLEYDKFLDENDWDIYYWCTQVPPSTSSEYAEGGAENLANPAAASTNSPLKETEIPGGSTNTAASHAPPHTDPTLPTASENTTLTSFVTTDASYPGGAPGEEKPNERVLEVGVDTSGAGEWAQTVGRRKEPYRRPPERWMNSEILWMIRRHVEESKAGGGMKGEEGNKEGKEGSGLGQMPPVRNFEARGVVE
ncbi:Flavinator of succinate dehydrogenase-domain-containing protein [Terfezia claveryi]|nr:Flavinator of succinate dehydrogenase-domain-containing protein [Terfezia claveryi]